MSELKKKVVGVWVTPEFHALVKKAAEAEHRTISAFIELAIQDRLANGGSK
jgi:hypothetical protein